MVFGLVFWAKLILNSRILSHLQVSWSPLLPIHPSTFRWNPINDKRSNLPKSGNSSKCPKLFLLAFFPQKQPKTIETYQDIQELTSSMDFLQDSSKIRPLVSVYSPIFNICSVSAKIFKIWFLEFFLFLKWKTRHISSY